MARHPVMMAASVALVAALLLGACGGDDDPAATTASTAPASTSTTAEPTTTTTAEDPTTTSAAEAAGCASTASVPAEAQDVVEVAGDVDGDGHDDELRTYRLDDEWHLQVELVTGGGADLLIETFGGGVGVVGGADVDQDGRDEVWARTGSGASALILGLARFSDCTLTWVTLPGGPRAELPVGGSVGSTAGVDCTTSLDPAAHLSAFTTLLIEGGPQYEVRTVEYALEGDRLVELANDSAVVSAEDPTFVRYASFTCGELAL